MPARIVAVTRLALDVHQDLATDPGLDFGSAAGALLFILDNHWLELKAIHDAAVKEMQALAPALLDRERGAGTCPA